MFGITHRGEVIDEERESVCAGNRELSVSVSSQHQRETLQDTHSSLKNKEVNDYFCHRCITRLTKYISTVVKSISDKKLHLMSTCM